MMGKLAKYSFFLYWIGITYLFFAGPPFNAKVLFFTLVCLFISIMCFIGWFFGGPITVVVKDDRDR